MLQLLFPTHTPGLRGGHGHVVYIILSSPYPMTDTKLSINERNNLATHLEAWVSLSRQECAALQNKIVDSILKDRGHSTEDPYATELVKTVR